MIITPNLIRLHGHSLLQIAHITDNQDLIASKPSVLVTINDQSFAQNVVRQGKRTLTTVGRELVAEQGFRRLIVLNKLPSLRGNTNL